MSHPPLHQFDQFRLGSIDFGLLSQRASTVEMFTPQCREHDLIMESQKAQSMTHTRDGAEHSLIHH